MNKRKWLAVLIVAVLFVTGCATTTTDDPTSTEATDASDRQSSSAAQVNGEVTLDVLFMANYNGKDAPILKDQLEKAGINVNLVQTPDYTAYKEKIEAGSFDIAFTGWTTVTGNPDYAVRSLFTPDGDYNVSGLDDAEITALIEQAGTETPDQYVATYAQMEQALMDHAYIVPLYNNFKSQAYNHDVLVPGAENVRLSKSRSMVWEAFDFNDTALRDTQPLLLTQSSGALTSLDPIKGNDGSINMLNTNQYVRLVNLTDDDIVTAEGALSYNFAIAEGNQSYYFILRDDINFATKQNGQAVDTGELVAAEDVVYSLNRAKDKDAVEGHRTYTLHGHMDTISIVADLAELESAVDGAGNSIKSVLEEGLATPIASLVTSKDQVDNGAGTYQVVKIDTVEAFPQVLNFLAHQSAGIVSEKQVSAVNASAGNYGDQTAAVNDNHIYASGPYVLIDKNDQKAVFQKNPAYQVGTDNEANIKTVEVLFVEDSNAAVQALMNGELHVLYSVPPLHYSKVESAENLTIAEIESNSVAYLVFNLKPDFNSPTLNEDLRKAVLNAVDAKVYIQIVSSGRASETTSTVTPLIKNLPGYVEVVKPTDTDAAKTYLQQYFEAQ